MSQKYYVCATCGKIIEVVNEAKVDTICCGSPMKELIPCSTDGDKEKHVPFVKIDGRNVHVTIGEVEHPMTEEHYIQWIAIETKHGMQRKCLKPDCMPKATFCLCEKDEFISAYAYCNIHGLWKK